MFMNIEPVEEKQQHMFGASVLYSSEYQRVNLQRRLKMMVCSLVLINFDHVLLLLLYDLADEKGRQNNYYNAHQIRS